MDFDKKAFGLAVKQKRAIEKNITMKELADQLSISHGTISRVENGFSPDIRTYGVLCAWMDMPLPPFFKL